MKIFIDSADIEEIRKAKSYGILDGITTNPSLIKKAVAKFSEIPGKREFSMQDYIEEILKEAGKSRAVSLEIISNDYKSMVREAEKLYDRFNGIADNVYIKIPVNPSFEAGDSKHFDGIKAIKELSEKGIRINCTLIFTPEQALLAAKAGAKILSPFAGRVDDYIREKAGIKFEKWDYFPAEGIEKGGMVIDDNGIVSGIDLIYQCAEIIKYHGFKCEILAASMRNPRQVREAMLAGADIATLPFRVIEEMLYHEKTFEGMRKFTEDAVAEYRKLFEK